MVADRNMTRTSFKNYLRQLGRKLDLWCPALAVPRQSPNRQPTEDHGDAGEHTG